MTHSPARSAAPSGREDPGRPFAPTRQSGIRGALLVAWLLVMLAPGLRHGLWRPDEHRVAGICAEMARTRQFLVPHLNGEPFLEKPPLYYAVGATFAMAFGERTDLPYRLASLLFAGLVLALTFAMARRRLGVDGATAAAGVLASSWLFFRSARWVQVDVALVFAVVLAADSYLRWLDGHRARHSVLLAAALAAAFMTKGLVGPALIAAAVVADTIRLRQPANLWRLRPLLITAVAGLPVIVWTAALWARGGWPFVHEVIVVNNLMRFAGTGAGAALGHQHGVGYYLERIPGDLAPWSLLLIPALADAFRRYRSEPMLSWIIGPLVMLCLSSTKRDVYLLPLYPAAAVILAAWLQDRTPPRPYQLWLWRATWAAAAVLCAAPFAGLLLHQAVLALVLGAVGVAAFAMLNTAIAAPVPAQLRLVLAACIGMCCTSAVYFKALGPAKDYLAFAREVLEAAGGEELTVLCPDEALDGVLPLVAGRNLPEAASPEDIRSPGLFAWVDSRNRISDQVRSLAETNILLRRRFGSHKYGIVARLTPLADTDATGESSGDGGSASSLAAAGPGDGAITSATGAR